jgi:hypothetical protein
MEVKKMDEFIEYILKGNVIDVGEVRVAKTGLGKRTPGSRFVIYLPLARNYVWEVLHTSGHKVRVFIEVPTDIARKQEV